MIKTDKVIYRARTREEYDWLMEKLDEAGCEWYTERKPTGLDIFYTYKSDTCIFVEDKKLTYTHSDSCKNELDYEFIEVSDLMENEKITDEPSEQEDKPKKIKKIVYTTEVYFE